MSDEGMSDAELAYHRARAYQRPGSTDTEMTIEKESMRALIARLDAAERERDALREAIVAVVTGSMPRKVGVVWRADKRPSKHDLCVHSQVMSCDCGDCTDEFLNGVLAALTANHSAPVGEE